jgi:hypothetical protein
MVAGINVAAHSVFSWVTPVGGFDVQVAGWTDMGIVMERIACSALGGKTVTLEGLDGHTVAALGTGTFVGVVPRD